MSTLFTAHADGRFRGEGLSLRCVLGKGGVAAPADKREGDGASPLGVWPMRRVFYRPDRLAPPETGLSKVPLAPHDGWCDDPAHRLYNRPIQQPFNASHERLWRDDHVYDLIVELGYNDDPVTPGAGSAIFFHLTRPDLAPTEGCVALSLEDFLAVLMRCSDGSCLEIAP
ncbi:MAG: L,D-transpeptidase family protein [Pseudomonadota bacterium]